MLDTNPPATANTQAVNGPDDYVAEHVAVYVSHFETANESARNLIGLLGGAAVALSHDELQQFCDAAGVAGAYPLLSQLKSFVAESVVA